MDSKWLPSGEYKINSVAFQYIVVECNCVNKVVHAMGARQVPKFKDAILDTSILDVAILDLSNKTYGTLTESIASIEP